MRPHTFIDRLATLRRAARIAAVAVLATHAGAYAAPVAIGGGFDYYTDSRDQATRAGFVIGVLNVAGTEAFVAGLRFDAVAVGEGNGVTGGIGVPVAPLVQLRLSGSRFTSDDRDYRAWRAKAGPQVRLPAGPRIGAYYTHDDGGGDAATDGVVAEGDVPLLHGLGLRATAGYAKSASGDRGVLGSIGASWQALRALSVSAEVGSSASATFGTTSMPGPHRPTDALPILGGGGRSSTTTTTAHARTVSMLLGVRVSFP